MEQMREGECSADFPRRLVHWFLPQTVAKHRCRAGSIPMADFLALVVEVQVVNDCVGVKPKYPFHSDRVDILQKSVAAISHDRVECVDDGWPNHAIVVRHARRATSSQ